MPVQNFKVGEMLNKRSPNSKTWLNFDGSYTTEIYSGQVHFSDEAGNMHNINTDLYDEADLNDYEGPIEANGKELLQASKERAQKAKKEQKLNRDLFDFQGLKVPFMAKLPRNFKSGYRIGKGGETLRFKPVGASPAKGYIDEEHANRIHYQDAWNDADVTLELTETGVKETIILKTDRAPSRFSFEVEGPLEDDLTAGTMKLAPAWLQDANGEKRDVLQAIRREGDKTYIDLPADVEGLVYPIEIDPTVIIQPDGTTGKDTMVYEGAKTTNYGSSVSINFGSGNAGGTAQRALFQFDLSSIPNGATISDAVIYFQQINQGGNTERTFNIHKVTNTWDEMVVVWDNQPTYGVEIFGTYTGAGVGTYATTSIKDLAKFWVDNPSLNYGLMIKEASENVIAESYKQVASSEHGTVNSRPQLSITYNAPPTAPRVTAPNGGETWNSQHTVTWIAADDGTDDNSTPQTNLQYQIQLTTNNAASWKDIVALTTVGATNYTYDFINEQETSIAKIRVRAFDGSGYGPWDESDGVFTIVHNVAPTAPTNLSPSGSSIDRAIIQRLSWQHNDPNSNDPQAKFDLQWRLQGQSTWNDVTQDTPSQFWDAPANTFPRGTIEWKVRGYDQAGLSGPYSDVVTFFAGDKPPEPTYINPADNSNVAVARPLVQWSSVGQTGYLLEVFDETGNTKLWELNRNSNNKAETVGINLENNTNYIIRLSIRNADGLYSNVITSRILVSYTPPAVAALTTETDTNRGAITVNINNPVPTGTEPNVTYNDVFRRENGGEWIRVATNVANNGSFVDYQAKPNANIQYYVTTFGDNGTLVNSQITAETVSLLSSQLSMTSENIYLNMNRMTNLGNAPKVERTLSKFAGRAHSVAIFGEQEENPYDLSFVISTLADLETMEDILNAKETLLLRDRRGRKVFVTIDSISVDEQPTRWILSMNPIEVDYKEGV